MRERGQGVRKEGLRRGSRGLRSKRMHVRGRTRRKARERGGGESRKGRQFGVYAHSIENITTIGTCSTLENKV